jgi:hypothetical protein
MSNPSSAKKGRHVSINVDAADEHRGSGSATNHGPGARKSSLRQPLLPQNSPIRHSSSCQMLGDALAKYIESDEEETSPKGDENKPPFSSSPMAVDPEGSQKRRLMRARTAPILQRNMSIHKVKQKKVTRARVLMLQAALALLFYLFLGMLIYALQRDDFRGYRTHPIIDSMYFSMVTMTTTGERFGNALPEVPAFFGRPLWKVLEAFL